MSERRTSDDFAEGQTVVCCNPEHFLAEKRRYLAGRNGVVIKTTPASMSREQRDKYAGHINSVLVEWQRKGNRGKIQRMWMYPEDIAVTDKLA